MLHLESPHQAIYAPLNQVMTDSDDSEEEIHNSTKHRQHQLLYHHQQQQQQQNGHPGRRNPPNSLALKHSQNNLQTQSHYRNHYNSTAPATGSNNNSNGNGYQHPPSSYTTNMQNTFRSVMMSDIGPGEQGSNFSSFNSDYDERNQTDADNVAILGRSSSSKNLARGPMSPARRCCFVASLLLCAFAIIGFVWVVPCDKTCPSPVDRVKTHNWLNNYTKIELKGGVNIVNGLRSWENNLIFLYRGDAFFPEFANNAKRNGIISLVSSGAVAWFDEMKDEPVAIDCTLLDVDHNGRPDCLVIDEFGELGAIDPISGEWHWRFRERSAHKVDALDFPVMLPDLDGDGVLELLVVSSAALEQRAKSHVYKGEVRGGVREQRNFLRILSGSTGKPMGDGFRMRDCDVLRRLRLENAQVVTFSCLRNSTEAQRSKKLADLFALITNKSIAVGQKLLPASKIAQHRHYGQRKDTDAQRNIYSLSGRELVVENRGKCPEDCNVTFVLCETRDNKTNVLRNFTKSGMYGMVPAQWHFKNTKREMSGFVMKFWKWGDVRNAHSDLAKHNSNSFTFKKSHPADKEEITKSSKQNHISSNRTKQRRRKRGAKQEPKSFPTNSNEFSIFDHLVQTRHTYTLPLAERSVVRDAAATNSTRRKRSSNLLLDNYNMQLITETVILVLFHHLFALITNKSIAVGQKLLPASKIAQHRHYGQRKDTDAQRNIYSLSGRELVVENRGKCPEDCNVTFVLCETRDNKTNVLRNFTKSGMYGMVPAQWHFKNTKREMSGFVMKFWKWGDVRNAHSDLAKHNSNSFTFKKSHPADKEEITKSSKQNHISSNRTKQRRRKRGAKQEPKSFPTNSNEFSIFDHLVQTRHTYTLPLAERSVVRDAAATNSTRRKRSSNLLLDNYNMQLITETVILVLFIGADTRIENTSQSDIVQFCRNDHNELICQPDLNNQENSMLIADFDFDGSQELVSYSSTFVQRSDDPEDWKLVTYVRMLRLQAELPVFYEEEQHN